ncbi:MAG: cyclase family protein [Vicinamibacterales bacterium]|jgi:kynurenine formamidase|nr:cyclase [Acidobacteriota bacterium]MDP7472168.1 cyclase family protein [Vicinamibacterales bacterium]MDP7670874.1 cyclase family protein [Vicinamibacterales bacterium]HJO39619.1 cyclase family protein [Vicinamibacterales bacterium]
MMPNMNRIARVALAAALCLYAAASAGGTVAAQARPVSAATLEAWIEELSNWGRWGPDDQLGTLNLVTAEKRREAVDLVQDGVSVSLARDAEKVEAADNPSPWIHEMRGVGGGGGSMDTYTIDYHGVIHTHLDSLCHAGREGQLYNGIPQSTVREDGCAALGVDRFKNGIITRGILIDIPWLRGVDYLEPDVVIYSEDLDAWEEKSGVTIRPGDAVFIRTGRWARRAAVGPWNVGAQGPGPHASTAHWFKARDVAIVGTDVGTDVRPSGVEGAGFPLHDLLIFAMGMPLLDNCDLEAISRAARARGRWEFMLTAAPLAVPGGTGSPINPIGIF